MIKKDRLYILNSNAVCLNCGHKGAVQFYGSYYPYGLGDDVDKFGEISREFMQKYRNKPYMSSAVGFGGTIPYECTNCGSVGLIDMDRFEGYNKAFTIKKE
jgi:hypothetical protein